MIRELAKTVAWVSLAFILATIAVGVVVNMFVRAHKRRAIRRGVEQIDRWTRGAR
jgi:hypothetical protein